MAEDTENPRIITAEQSRIVLSERGRWIHEGEPFDHPKIIEFFHRAIRKDSTGHYFLENQLEGKLEHVYFVVEDTAYFVKHFARISSGDRLHASLNTSAAVEIDPRTMEEDDRGVLYCRVLDGDRARVTTNALHDLSDLVGQDDRGIFLEHNGERIYLKIG